MLLLVNDLMDSIMIYKQTHPLLHSCYGYTTRIHVCLRDILGPALIMNIINRTFMLEHHALAITFGINLTLLGVSAVPVMVAVGIIFAAGLLSSKSAHIRMAGLRIVRLLRGKKRYMQKSLQSNSIDDLIRKASPWMIIAAGAIVLLYGIMLLGPSGEVNNSTLKSWALHMGIWACVSGIVAIVVGVWKKYYRNQVSSHPSKPSKTNKRFCDVITDEFQNDQQMFIPPFSDRLKNIHRYKW